MAILGLSINIFICLSYSVLGIPLPGLETSSSHSAHTGSQDGGNSENIQALPHLSPTPRPSIPSPSSANLDLSALQHMSAIDFLRLLATGAAGSSSQEPVLQQLISGGSSGPQVPTSGGSAVARPFHGSRPTDESVGSSLYGQSQQPYYTTGQSQYIQQPHSIGTLSQSYSLQQSGQSVHRPQGGQSVMRPGYGGIQNPNQLPQGQYYSSGAQPAQTERRPSSSGGHPGGSSLGVGIGSGFQPNKYNHAQLYTNPMYMLTGGLDSQSNGKVGSAPRAKDQQVPKPIMKAQTAFNPDQLMNSLLSPGLSAFNPDKYTAEQTFVSTSDWRDGYAGKPTGYSGMFVPDESSPGQAGTSQDHQQEGQYQGMQQVSQNQYNAKMNFVPTNMLAPGGAPGGAKNVKFTFDPDRINQFAGSFHPGQIAPVAEGPRTVTQQENIHNTDHTNEKLSDNSPKHETPRPESVTKAPEVNPSTEAMQLQHQDHRVQMAPFNTNFGSMNSKPAFFMAPFSASKAHEAETKENPVESLYTQNSPFDFVPGNLYPGFKLTRSVKEKRDSYSAEDVVEAFMANLKFLEKLVNEDTANQLQNEQHTVQNNTGTNATQQNVTVAMTTKNVTSQPVTNVQTTTVSLATPTDATYNVTTVSNSNDNNTSSVTTTATPPKESGGFNPDAVNAGQMQQGVIPSTMFGYGGPNSYNPNKANQGAGFNPAMSPGMTSMAFAGMQFGQLGPSMINGTSGGLNANFDPSQLTRPHMSFDINAQMGIMSPGNSGSPNNQPFSGGYDPVKTNIMAMQNPFNPQSGGGNSNQTDAFSFSNAFMKPFNPNSVNEALMNQINPKGANGTNTGNGGDFMSFYLGVGGGTGFGGSFNPSSVNTAVFDPDEVNRITMHFDPTEMLERNPGYDKDKATAYKFDANKVNQMHGQNFVPTFLGNTGNKNPTGSDNNNQTRAESFGTPQGFLPGSLTGGGNQGVKFDPNSFNNLTIQLNPMANTNQVPGIQNVGNSSMPFDPTSINNMHMNFDPYIMGPGNSNPFAGSESSSLSGEVHEFNTNHKVPVVGVPKLQGGNKDGNNTASSQA